MREGSTQKSSLFMMIARFPLVQLAALYFGLTYVHLAGYSSGRLLRRGRFKD